MTDNYVSSRDMKKIISELENIVQKIEDPEYMDLYDKFADSIYSKLNSVVTFAMPLSSTGAHSLATPLSYYGASFLKILTWTKVVPMIIVNIQT
jgi:hypothetical protein